MCVFFFVDDWDENCAKQKQTPEVQAKDAAQGGAWATNRVVSIWAKIPTGWGMVGSFLVVKTSRRAEYCLVFYMKFAWRCGNSNIFIIVFA